MYIYVWNTILHRSLNRLDSQIQCSADEFALSPRTTPAKDRLAHHNNKHNESHYEGKLKGESRPQQQPESRDSSSLDSGASESSQLDRKGQRHRQRVRQRRRRRDRPERHPRYLLESFKQSHAHNHDDEYASRLVKQSSRERHHHHHHHHSKHRSSRRHSSEHQPKSIHKAHIQDGMTNKQQQKRSAPNVHGNVRFDDDRRRTETEQTFWNADPPDKIEQVSRGKTSAIQGHDMRTTPTFDGKPLKSTIREPESMSRSFSASDLRLLIEQEIVWLLHRTQCIIWRHKYHTAFFFTAITLY